ncbi:MAG: hypothetical protein K8F93_11985 [Burkholderiales bacterium]|nr:hypothetical protein [Burkholderiales bacterium]MCL4687801.1 hypothetical protein [Burkholderiales bacterium]
MRQAEFRQWLAAILVPIALLWCEARAAPAENTLPLETGRRWELVSAAAGQSMSLEVAGRSGDAWVVRWNNPWVNATFHFVLDGGRVLLAALDMGTGLAKMPPGTVYFDLGAPAGRQWSNALGKVSVVEAGKSVGGHRDGKVFRLVDPKGARTYWTLSPTGGFLAFGQGDGAFVLSRATSAPPPPTPSAAAAPWAPASEGPARPGAAPVVERMRVGLDSNPPPTEGYDEASRLNRARMAARAGVNYVYAHPKWTEAEPSAGRYDFGEVDFKARVSQETGAPLSLNLRMIDTNQRAIPSRYRDWRFSDERMAARLADVLRAIAPRTRGRVRWIAIGNESDNYFKSREGEIADYAVLIRRVLPVVRELFPEARFTINFTHAAAGSLATRYAPLLALCDVVSFTYYPLNADFTFQDPSVAGRDVDAMMAAAGTRQVLFQEIGYASSPVVGSSEERQASFITEVFGALRRHRGRVIAANFVWMSDLPQSVVDDLGRYYGAAGVEKFKAFLGSLGYWGRDGRPKKAWAAFEREAARP